MSCQNPSDGSSCGAASCASPAPPPVLDAPKGNWVDRFAPSAVKPYLRLMRADRPIGTWLLLLPCWWSVALAAGVDGQALPNLLHLALFAIGAFVMRGAGCVWNDILDRHIDAQVVRTRARPLPSGQVSVKQAIVFMAALCTIGGLVLLPLNHYTQVLALASLLIVAVYPLMKRISDWPQAVLGLAFNWGALLGWTAAFGTLSEPAILLYMAGIFWTLGYDTIYALQDLEDDALIGVRSTARLFGSKTKEVVTGFYGLTLALMGFGLILAEASLPAFIGLMGFGVMLGRQLSKLDLRNPSSALLAFRMNRNAGLVLFAGLAADCLIRSGVLG